MGVGERYVGGVCVAMTGWLFFHRLPHSALTLSVFNRRKKRDERPHIRHCGCPRQLLSLQQ